MTTIAYLPGVIAADTQVTSDGSRIGYATKVARAGRLLFGAVGTLSYVQAFLAWAQDGMRDADKPVTEAECDQGIVCDGRTVTTYDNQGRADRIEADLYAIGSGAKYALGAMASGATPQVAVTVAAMFDTRTGGLVDVRYGA
jgi:ATP-dependent protease HslVU (ClpYQ) peptidase subunit